MTVQKKVTVFCKGQYEGEWPPVYAVECVQWFTKKLELIPLEYRATAKIEIDNYASGYEDGRLANIDIYYCRPETAEETVVRESEERRRQNWQKEEELQTLAKLKAKYES